MKIDFDNTNLLLRTSSKCTVFITLYTPEYYSNLFSSVMETVNLEEFLHKNRFFTKKNTIIWSIILLWSSFGVISARERNQLCSTLINYYEFNAFHTLEKVYLS